MTGPPATCQKVAAGALEKTPEPDDRQVAPTRAAAQGEEVGGSS